MDSNFQGESLIRYWFPLVTVTVINLVSNHIIVNGNCDLNYVKKWDVKKGKKKLLNCIVLCPKSEQKQRDIRQH